MILDIDHELEILRHFFTKQVAWIETEYAKLGSVDVAKSRSSEQVECELFHPEGPGSIEQLIWRMTIKELNALIETFLQARLADLKGFLLERGAKTGNASRVDVVYSLPRTELEKSINDYINLTTLPGYAAVQIVREIAEGNKHRERLRPVPLWNKAAGTLVEVESLVAGRKGCIDSYEIELGKVSEYLSQTRVFFDAFRAANLGAV